MLAMRTRGGARCLISFLACCTGFAYGAHVHARPLVDFRESRTVAAADGESIQAFDLSPDGKLLAVLSQSESTHDSWLRVVVEDIATGRCLASLRIDTGTRPDLRELPPWYIPHLQFSANQRFLVFQDWASVRAVDLSNFRVARIFTSASKRLGAC